MNWKPIETAPRDGTRFLGRGRVFSSPGLSIRYKRRLTWFGKTSHIPLYGWAYGDDVEDIDLWHPTQWMPGRSSLTAAAGRMSLEQARAVRLRVGDRPQALYARKVRGRILIDLAKRWGSIEIGTYTNDFQATDLCDDVDATVQELRAEEAA